MSRARRFRGHEGCCTSDSIDPAFRGGEQWANPFVATANGGEVPGGPMTTAEQDACILIEGGRLWETDSKGNRLIPPPGLPHPGYDKWLQRETNALAVIMNGGGELNQIRDWYAMKVLGTYSMPIEWYRQNQTPANRAERERHKAETGYGHDAVTLWCKPCSTSGEQFRDDLEKTGLAMVPVGRGIAMALSYIPVWGTAVSFLLNTSISLALGEDIDDAVLDGVGGALPGQPASGMAFNAVRSIARGDRLDKLAIELLPIDQYEKDLLWTAVQIVEAIADGQKITKIAMDVIYNELPPAGKKAMDLAKRVANGDRILDIAKDEGKDYVDAQLAGIEKQVDEIKRTVSDINQQAEELRGMVMQAGYQGAVNTLSENTKAALTAGIIAGKAQREKTKLERGGFTTEETNKAGNDILAAKGRAIIESGAVFRYLLQNDTPFSVSLVDVRKGNFPMTVTHKTRYDSVSGITLNETWSETFRIENDAMRRGFDVGIGLNEGRTGEGPDQNKVRASLTLANAQAGFDAASNIQFIRTKEAEFERNLGNVATQIVKDLSEDDRRAIENYASKGVAIEGVDPKVKAARTLSSDLRYQWGFDVGTGVTQGMSVRGPGQDGWRVKLGPSYGNSGIKRGTRGSNEAIQGFDVAQALQHGITKEREQAQSKKLVSNYAITPAERAGALIANGLSNSGAVANTKVAVIAQTFANPSVMAGASASIQKKQQGFIGKLFSIFGL